MALDESTDSDDVVEETDGVKIVYEKNLGSELRDAVIYYSDRWYNRGFKIDGALISSC